MIELINPWTSPYKSRQGNIGLGKSISLFTEIGITVLLPLNDTQDYDIAIDVNNKLLRVSVKTTRYKSNSGKYSVLLKRSGGSSKSRKLKTFNNQASDFLFCYTENGEIYLIPTRMIPNKSSITLSGDTEKYKVYTEGKLNLSALEEILNVEAP